MSEARQIIKAIAPHEITISWEQDRITVPDSSLTLNFAPFYDIYDLSKTDVLLHFQAKPKELRKWGVYQNNQYHSVKTVKAIAQSETLTVHDIYTPSNVILYRNAQLLVFPNLIKIYQN